MADIAITELPSATYATVDDVFPIVQDNITKQITNTLLFTSPTLTTPVLVNAILGTPASGNLNNCTGSPVLTAPTLGTPVSGNISNCTGSPTLTAPTIGDAIASSVSSTGSILITTTGKLGYTTGSGGTVTQLTSKATAVTLNKTNGQITLNNAALAADTTVSFTLNNTAIVAGDVLVLNHISGGTIGSYTLNAASAANLATIYVRNVSTGSLSEAIVIAYAVIKAVTA